MKSKSIQSILLGVFMLTSLPLFSTHLSTTTVVQNDLHLTTKVETLNDLTQLPVSDESSQRLYLVRHGESTANVYFIVDGKSVRYVSGKSTEIPLTETGEAQIRSLAEKLAERFPNQARLVITSSSAIRTQKTAQILFNLLSKTHPNVILAEEIYQGMDERHLGEWEGRLKDEKYTLAEAPWRTMSAYDKFTVPEVPGGESYTKVANRSLSALAEIHDRYIGSTVIVATSFNTINATAIQMNKMDSILSDVAGSNLPKLALGNGDLVLLEASRNQGFTGVQVVSHIKHED